MKRNLEAVERIASVALGGLAVGVYLRRQEPRSAPWVVAGAALLLRGATGYCPLKSVCTCSSSEGGRKGRRKVAGSPEESWQDRKDVVQEASEESFPASDPPSFNPGVVH